MIRFQQIRIVRAIHSTCVEGNIPMRKRMQRHPGGVFAVATRKKGASLFPRSSLLPCIV